MSRSVDRVKAAAEAAGLAIEVVTMPSSTRTAEEAADACGTGVGQIVKLQSMDERAGCHKPSLAREWARVRAVCDKGPHLGRH